MSCVKPLIRAETFETYINKKGGKSYKTEFLERTDFDKYGEKFLQHKYRKIQPIPCGQCIECRLQYSRDWATRIMLEKENGYNCNFNEYGPYICRPYPDGTTWFLTLTYADEYLPTYKTFSEETGEILEGISLKTEDLQKFWKRLRKAYPQMKIKYLACGEYGKQTQRPHYHAIVFGLPLEQEDFKKVGMNNLNQPTWELEKLSSIWGEGFVNIGRVTWESAAYVARYTLKKATNKQDKQWDYANGRLPEYINMSNGIGKEYFLINKEKIYQTDSVPIKNKKTGVNVKPPKSFDRLLKESDQKLYEDIKYKRKKNGQAQEALLSYQTNLTPEERRRISEERMERVIKDLRMEI